MLSQERPQSWSLHGGLSPICCQPPEVCTSLLLRTCSLLKIAATCFCSILSTFSSCCCGFCSIPASTCFYSTPDAGLVLEWEQTTGLLYAAGDVRLIRVWDTHKERKIQDIPTGADSCVTCLASDSADRSLMVAGCGDGTVRLYDRRQPASSSLVQTLREHNSWIANVHMQHYSKERNIVSCRCVCVGGGDSSQGGEGESCPPPPRKYPAVIVSSSFWPKTMDYNKAFWPKLRSFFESFLLLTGRCYEPTFCAILLLLGFVFAWYPFLPNSNFSRNQRLYNYSPGVFFSGSEKMC